VEELIKLLINNEDDYFMLPHYGMVPDWYKRYWQLHKAVAEYTGYTDYFIPKNSEENESIKTT